MHPDSFQPQPTDRAQTAVAMLTPLPLAAGDLPGIGGVLKSRPEHFVVEEILPYQPCGQGEHVYITFRRSGWNTADAARSIQDRLALARSDVGWGGRKDKTAVVVQTLSVRCGLKRSLDDIKNALTELPFEIVDIKRHGNKIKTGHVAANRFTIVVNQPAPDALPRALVIAERLKQTGVPNYYGPQRFGHQLQNVYRGFSLFAAPKQGRRNPFMVSVVQSVLFNIWLKQRMQTDSFGQLIAGDMVKKTDTGGMFTAEDLSVDNRRFMAGEIVFTGPIFGFKMRPATQAAGKREADLLEQFDLTSEDFRPLRAPGSRRLAIVRLVDLTIAEMADGLQFRFTLPSGAYATTVMREFMQND